MSSGGARLPSAGDDGEGGDELGADGLVAGEAWETASPLPQQRPELPPGPPGGGTSVRPVQVGGDVGWTAEDWEEVRTRAERAGRAYVWINLVEQRLRSLVAAVLRPVYEPLHGEEWILVAAGPAGREWVRRAAAVREVTRRKGHLMDPLDDTVLAFLTLPQLRELLVQHWPCFEPYLAGRREVELALDELEAARSAVAHNRALTRAALTQTERTSSELLRLLRTDGPHGAAREQGRRLPADAVEQMVGDRFGDVAGVHPDRVRLQRRLPAEDLFGDARRLDAVGIGLNLLVQNYSGRRLARLAEAGCRARLLLLNPASGAMRRRERELGLKRGELARAVETNILHLRRVRARLRDPAALEIRVFDDTPRFTAYLVDADGPDPLAVVQPYLRRARGMESPAFVLRGPRRGVLDAAADGTGWEPGLFATYREEFESAWSDARPVS